jgi:hypothetical protein
VALSLAHVYYYRLANTADRIAYEKEAVMAVCEISS